MQGIPRKQLNKMANRIRKLSGHRIKRTVMNQTAKKCKWVGKRSRKQGFGQAAAFKWGMGEGRDR